MPSKAENTTGDEGGGFESVSEHIDFAYTTSVPQQHPNVVTIGLKVYTKKDVPVFGLTAPLYGRVRQNTEESEEDSPDKDENGSNGKEIADEIGGKEGEHQKEIE